MSAQLKKIMKINQTKKWVNILSDKNFFGPCPECETHSLIHLERTVSKCMDEVIRFLLTTRNNKVEQFTHIIARRNNDYLRKVMEDFLRLGADINGQESLNGFTPLHVCVLNGNYKLAEWLCERPDIDLEATNYAGKTAYQLALERNDSLFKKLLIDAGCKVPPLYVRRSDRIAKSKYSSPKSTLVRQKNKLKSCVRRLSFSLE